MYARDTAADDAVLGTRDLYWRFPGCGQRPSTAFDAPKAARGSAPTLCHEAGEPWWRIRDVLLEVLSSEISEQVR